MMFKYTYYVELISYHILSLILLSYQQEDCPVYAYNTTVEIPVARCFYNVDAKFNCEEKHFGKTYNIEKDKYNVQQCTHFKHEQLSSLERLDSNSAQGVVRVCESSQLVKLEGNKVHFLTYKNCDFLQGNCTVGVYKSILFWKPEICRYIVHLFNNSVAETVDASYRKLKKIELGLTGCNVELWETDKEGIVVSTNRTDNSTTKSNVVRSNKKCEVSNKPEEGNIETPSITTPVVESRPDCVSVTNSSLSNKCLEMRESVGCTNTRFCQQTREVDLTKDKIKGFPDICNYKSEKCEQNKACWEYLNECNAIQLTNETQNSEPDPISIETWCNINVSYSYSDGYFASKQLMPQSKSNTSQLKMETVDEKRYLQNELHEQNEQIASLNTLRNYLFIFMIVCFLWYIFNVIINFSSLTMLGKKKPPKQKCYLMNCFCQSLTQRYLFLNSHEPEKTKINMPQQPQSQDVYATVENEFYSK